MKAIFHFLGSIYFAIILIAVAAASVIAGTFMESYSGSHLFASSWTYGHPLFAILLGLFFINILFSALRRWPFKLKHIPFLITHLGLLMIIAGTIIKNRIGVQGNLTIWEGSSGQKVLLPNTYALSVEKHDGQKGEIALSSLEPWQTHFIKDLKVKIVGMAPHVTEKWETWIKGKQALITGIPPLPVSEWNPSVSLPEPLLIPISKEQIWHVLAIKTDQIEPLIQNNKVKREYPLLIIAEIAGGTSLYLFDKQGNMHHEQFGDARFKNLVSYDNGFGGYAVTTSLPDPNIDQEQKDCAYLCKQLREAMAKNPSLAPPLALFKQASDKNNADFIEPFVNFLVLWNHDGRLLFSPDSLPKPLDTIIPNLEIAPADQKALQWIALLFDRLEEPLKNGEDLSEYLKQNRWPFSDIPNDTTALTVLAQQIYAVSNDLPELEQENNKAKLLSAYLKTYGIDYPSIKVQNDDQAMITLEAPLTVRYQQSEPSNKYEDNHPAIIIEAQSGTEKEIFALAYDPSAMGFKWPILKGQYLIRLQPQSISIPYKIRLKQARQINYPQTQQPYSYEADIVIDGTPKTLSMNQVHETWDGYRLYLAGMSPYSENSVRSAHIIVNHDPAKYIFTYPGAGLVALGIILLFWLQPYKRRYSK